MIELLEPEIIEEPDSILPIREGSSTEDTSRLFFVDRLRVALTILVIAHHAGQAYGPTGGTWPITNPESSRLLSPFFAVNAMFFMGMFFMISGYFVPMAYDRHGAAAFGKSRLVRLGTPALFFAFFVFGPISYLGFDKGQGILDFGKYLHQSGYQELYVHLWFLLHLLLYSLVYILWRLLSESRFNKTRLKFRQPNHLVILIFAMVVAGANWIVRIRYPLDVWKPLLFVIPAEIGHLPQYVSMFIVGIVAYRRDWFRKLPTSTGWIWFSIGMIFVFFFYAYDLSGGDILSPWLGPQKPYGLIERGGGNWKSLLLSIWEAFICTGLGIGLLVLFRQFLNQPPGKLLSRMVNAQYGAFIIHILIVFGLQILMNDLSLRPFNKFVIVTILGTSFSFGLAILVRKIPGLRKII